MTQENDSINKVTISYSTETQLPIFVYGTLKDDGIEINTGERAVSLGRFVARGIALRMGDKFPCADITHDTQDTIEGFGMRLCSNTPEALETIDRYEGVNEGYYRRRIIFVTPADSHNLFVPMWIYERGEKLGNE